MRLQTILFPTEDICSVKEMYFHEKGEYIDFDGYFNLFQITNRQHYTTLKDVYLCLKLKGYEEIILMNDRDEVERHALQADCLKSYSFKLPYVCSKGVFWFSLKKSKIHDSYIEGFFDGCAENYRDTNIVVDICTYKREEYVEKNLKKLVFILENKEFEVGEHLSVYVVDNGKTLFERAEI